MAGLSAAIKNKVAEVLDTAYLTKHGLKVKSDDVVTVTSSADPQYQFVVSSIDSNGVFTTVESPGTHSDKAETFKRNDFEQCMNAVRAWVERIADRQNDWILDEFGGVADRNPSLPTDSNS